jgi:flagellar motor protein MotB
MKILGPVVAAMLLALCACHSPDPQSPVAGLNKPVDPPKMPGEGHGAARVEVHPLYGIWVTTVRETCGGPDPFFSFDSSKADTEDQETMKNLVFCMKQGPLVGKSITVTGRTDPRGTEEYNEKLGLERAERVKRYLVSKGIDPARVKTKSVGKDGADPLPKDWPSDRRVDIQVTPSP